MAPRSAAVTTAASSSSIECARLRSSKRSMTAASMLLFVGILVLAPAIFSAELATSPAGISVLRAAAGTKKIKNTFNSGVKETGKFFKGVHEDLSHFRLLTSGVEDTAAWTLMNLHGRELFAVGGQVVEAVNNNLGVAATVDGINETEN